MKIGISLSNYGDLPNTSFLKDAAIEIENSNLDSIWLSDHIIVPKENKPWNRVFETISTLGFLAAITKKVQLGSSIIILPLRDPFLLGKQIATLDALSEGRVLLGLAIGWNKREFNLMEKDFEGRTKTFETNIQTMKRMWSGEYSKQGFSCEPMPISSTGPPILIGGQSRGALNRVSLIGDGWHPVGISPQQYDMGIKTIEKANKKEYIWSLRINFAANRKVESHYIGTDGGTRLRLVGNNDEIISQICQYEKVGLQHLVCDIRADSREEFFEQLKSVQEIKKSF